MKDADEAPRRLSQEPGTFEQELLRSARGDRPAAGVYAATLTQVLAEYRRDAVSRRYRAVGLVAGALAAAAGVALLVRSASSPPSMTAEAPPERASLEPSAAPPAAPAAPRACAPVSIGAGDAPLIDDFEDGDTRIPLLDKRAGSWIAYSDGTAKQEPRQGSVFPASRLQPPRGKSRFGLRSTGGKFTKWGAALAIELTPHRCYDASAYGGVAFWARGRASVRVNLRMSQIVAEEYGGTCVADCYDSHGTLRALTSEWKRYEVRWADVAQQGFGAKVPFDPRFLYSVEFALPQGQPPFDLWIDDVVFLQR
jgi:Carbohydrate binding domain (family 11)